MSKNQHIAEALSLVPDLKITRNPRARRLILRLAIQGDDVEVVAPRRTSEREIARFVARHHEWLAERLAVRPPHVPFTAGATIPFGGIPHCIKMSRSLRGVIDRKGGVITVPCLPEHLSRRVRDYLMREARTALQASVARHAETLGVKMPRITLRDTTTRWGSCSHKGNLSFSWRLIMAPRSVLDYVAAHEMAHIKQMNHGPKFWKLCEELAPQTEKAREWLQRNGASLHRYG